MRSLTNLRISRQIIMLPNSINNAAINHHDIDECLQRPIRSQFTQAQRSSPKSVNYPYNTHRKCLC